VTYIEKPRVRHPGLEQNELGLTRRDYEGRMSTLCAGCGHDSVTAAIVEAFWRLAVPPHRVAKVSGIGCSAKTPTYFLDPAHGFNAVHGRMPSIVTGANAAARDLVYIGVSGDGDSLSIGLGQLCHAVRRNVNMLYVLENNGVYGLTKGQFSASADVGSVSRRGEENRDPPIDPIHLALALGGGFIARSFSGDRAQLVPILEAGLTHPGFALVDVISPCVTFNDHEGSTRSYAYTREHACPTVEADFVPPAAEITARYEPGAVRDVRMHDGSVVRFRKLPEDYDPTDRAGVQAYLREREAADEVATGLLYLEPDPETGSREMHSQIATARLPLRDQPFEELCPGSDALDELMERWR